MPPDARREAGRVVTVEGVGDTTNVTVTGSGYTSDHTLARARPGMEQCLDTMAASTAEAPTCSDGGQRGKAAWA